VVFFLNLLSSVLDLDILILKSYFCLEICTISLKQIYYIFSLAVVLISSCQTEQKEQNLNDLIEGYVEDVSAPEFTNRDTLIFEDLADNEITQDSAGTLFIGDCFVLDSFPEYGFMCYMMLGTSTCAMAPVHLDTNQSGLESFINGTIRMVGIGKNKYVEGMHVWCEENKQEFLSTFNKVGNLNISEERPDVKSFGTMLDYNKEDFEHFVWMQDNTYSEENKIYPKVHRIVVLE
jgi:hypothetical protein